MLSHYVATSSTSVTTSTQASITVSTTPIPDGSIPVLLDILVSSTNYLKDQILQFPGYKAFVSTYLTQCDYIISNINQLRSEVPKTTLAEVSLVANNLEMLKDEYNMFLISFIGNVKQLYT